MPREIVLCWYCSACHMKGLILADARCPSLNNFEVCIFKKEMAHKLATIQNCSGLWNGTGKSMFMMEGMLEGE